MTPAGVKVMVRAEPEPETASVPRPGCDSVALTTKLLVRVSTSLTRKSMVRGTLAAVVWSLKPATVGGWLTYVTVSGKDVELVRVPSVTVKVMVLVPLPLVTADGRLTVGTIWRVRLPPEPPKVSLPTNPAGLSPLLAAVTSRLLAAVTDELTVKGTSKFVEFSGVVCGPINEI